MSMLTKVTLFTRTGSAVTPFETDRDSSNNCMQINYNQLKILLYLWGAKKQT